MAKIKKIKKNTGDIEDALITKFGSVFQKADQNARLGFLRNAKRHRLSNDRSVEYTSSVRTCFVFWYTVRTTLSTWTYVQNPHTIANLLFHN